MNRSLTIQTTNLIGQTVLLKGWAATIRDHGKIAFVDLRDRSGLIQVVTDSSSVKDIKTESVIEVEGLVKERPDHLINTNLETGKVEIESKSIKLLAPSVDLPIPVGSDGGEIEESLRLKYRYLDLRRSRLNQNIKNRSKLVQAFREYLFKDDFTEIETPLLTKSTPEGSRDFLVPSRLQPGKFYALPQSPQQYKQLLMTAGFERYFQIARAVRDEDLRADRGFEHTQVDIEMSFMDQKEVMDTIEAAVCHAIEKLSGKILKKPFPVYTYEQAIKEFGEDKFDLRSEKEKEENKLAFAWVIDFPFFEKTETGGWTFTHNPFSMPKPEFLDDLLAGKNIENILTSQYDLVCNGFEVGGGSIRSNKPEILKAVYRTMGYSDSEIEESVGHMLEAFAYGTPPHGGIALGVERLVMILQNEIYLREVQAFPQTGRGQTSVMQAPSEATPEQLQELKLKIVNKK